MPSTVKALPLLRCFKSYDVVLLGAALWALGWYLSRTGGGFPLDDAWIHQVYGRNLAQTGLWAFVPGQVSAASTAPLYTILLALGYRLGVPYALWTHGLGLLALWLAGVLAGRLGERLSAQLLAQPPRLIGLLTGLTVVWAWHVVWAAVAGMETVLFGLWTLALALLALREATLPTDAPPVVVRGVVFGLVAGLSILTRPDGLVLVGLIGGLFLLLLLKPQAQPAAGVAGQLGRTVLFGIVAGVVCLGVLLPYLLLNLRVTGGLLPDTAAAKQAEYAALLADPYLLRLASMLLPLAAGVQLVLLPAFVAYALAFVRRKQVLPLLLVVWPLALVALYAARLPAPYQHGRYVIPALPLFLVAGVVGCAEVWHSGRRHGWSRVLTRTLAATAALALVYFLLGAGAAAYQKDVQIIQEEMVTTAQWVRDHLPADSTRLAVHDIGAVGYFAPRPILDLAGLVSPEIVPFIRDADQVWAWLAAQNATHLMAFPDQIPGANPLDKRLCLLFSSGGQTAEAAGGAQMAVYAIHWDEKCA